jgi:4-hydroxyphenylpyruvate dioxygenase
VEDATSAYQETMKRGARSFMEPTVEKDEFGVYKCHYLS